MTDIVERAEAALEGVTEGPWAVYESCDNPGDASVTHETPARGAQPLFICPDCGVVGEAARSDAEFIASARSLVPELVSELKATRAERDGIEHDRDFVLRELAHCDAVRVREHPSRTVMTQNVVDDVLVLVQILDEHGVLTQESAPSQVQHHPYTKLVRALLKWKNGSTPALPDFDILGSGGGGERLVMHFDLQVNGRPITKFSATRQKTYADGGVEFALYQWTSWQPVYDEHGDEIPGRINALTSRRIPHIPEEGIEVLALRILQDWALLRAPEALASINQ